MKSLICIWIALCFIGCGNSEKKEVLELVKEWNGKEILFPTESYTTVLGKDTFMMEENPEYKVVVYTVLWDVLVVNCNYIVGWS